MELRLGSFGLYRKLRKAIGMDGKDRVEVVSKEKMELSSWISYFLLVFVGMGVVIFGAWFILPFVLSNSKRAKMASADCALQDSSDPGVKAGLGWNAAQKSRYSPPLPAEPIFDEFPTAQFGPASRKARLTRKLRGLLGLSSVSEIDEGIPLQELKHKMVGLPNGNNTCYLNVGLQLLLNNPDFEELVNTHLKPIFDAPETANILIYHMITTLKPMAEPRRTITIARRTEELEDELARIVTFINLFVYIKTETKINNQVLLTMYLLPLAKYMGLVRLGEQGDAKEAQAKLITPMLEHLATLSHPPDHEPNTLLSQRAAEAKSRLDSLFTITMQEFARQEVDIHGNVKSINRTQSYGVQTLLVGNVNTDPVPISTKNESRRWKKTKKEVPKPECITDWIVRSRELGSYVTKLPKYLHIEPEYSNYHAGLYERILNIPLVMFEKDIVVATDKAAPESTTMYELVSFVEHTRYIDVGHFIAYVKMDDVWYELNDKQVTMLKMPITTHPLIEPQTRSNPNDRDNRISTLVYRRVEPTNPLPTN
ncbi:hypothetical protein NEHOM01_1176 [Nematocida homosporus]|uniref:uncharacterized protein n=1 Tax=Nematocida homosporus TaxID=1912981 RepID=UPI00221EF95B|nr:uncharacterized protein NEHOM01_1176 [Nematocida homosporus]KAI5185953.1 hypothetical protein NEHOM01_1176 [Nematocida homosporus]